MAQPEIDLSTWATPLTLGALGANNAQRALGRLATAQSGNPHCLLKRSGSLWCNFAPEQSAELYVNTALGEHARQVEAGELFACAVSDDGRVWCEGTNGLGQLGQGTVGGGGAGFVQGLTKVAAVAVGLSRTCALRLDGTIWCRHCFHELRCAPDAAPLSMLSICDGVRDCADGSDERNCSPAQGYFECIDGSTIEVIQVCDQHVDCADGSDESRCL